MRMNEIKNDKCEWCGKTYPPDAKERYYQVQVFDLNHKICGDCFDHLKKGEINSPTKIKLTDYVKNGFGRANNKIGANQGAGRINNPTGKSNVSRDTNGRFITKKNKEV